MVAAPPGAKFVDKKDADKLAKDLGAADHIECSGLYQQNIKEVFDLCLRHAQRAQEAASTGSKPGGCCTIM